MPIFTQPPKQEPTKMVRATEPKKNKKLATPSENGAAANSPKTPKYIPIPDDEFEASLKYGLEKYDHIWRNLADK